MAIIKCPSCGCKTNSSLCPSWWKYKNKTPNPTKCTAREVNGKLERGCGYDEAIVNNKVFDDSVINSGSLEDY